MSSTTFRQRAPAPSGGVSEVSRASCASRRAKRAQGGEPVSGRPINRHYVSRRNFTGHRFLHNRRADYVMPDYRMTVRFLITFFITIFSKKRRVTSLKGEVREITREALYPTRLVRSPLKSSQKEFGMSDVSLAKAPSDDSQARWLRWAFSYADSIDPLKGQRLHTIIRRDDGVH